jgi:LCP family protein required for cell wall assembly
MVVAIGARKPAVGPGSGPTRGGTAGSRKRGRDPLWARTMVILGALLMVGSGVAIVGEKLVTSRYTDPLGNHDLGGGAATDAKGHVSIKGEINFLLVGVDERPDRDDARADSIMVLHIPEAHDRGYLISIPRDTYATVPRFAKGNDRHAGSQEKINGAYRAGGGSKGHGMELLAQAVNGLTGLKFQGGAVVNFDGFRSIVGVLGGVDMCIDEKVTSIHVGTNIRTGKFASPYKIDDTGANVYPIPGTKPQVYEKECRHLAPWEALDYVRQRDLLENGDGDYGRQRHQQQFIKAMMKGAASAKVVTNPAKLDAVLKATSKAFTFYGNGIALEDWIFALKDINPDQVMLIKTNAGKYKSETLPDGQKVEVFSEDSRELFRSVKDGTIDSFITAHSDWVSTER